MFGIINLNQLRAQPEGEGREQQCGGRKAVPGDGADRVPGGGATEGSRGTPQPGEVRCCYKGERTCSANPPATPISFCLHLQTPEFNTKSRIKCYSFYEALHGEGRGALYAEQPTFP